VPAQTLFESGMLDGTETGLLSSPIEAAERRLELLGPVWRAPSLLEVLRQLPFMRGQPQRVLDFLVRCVGACKGAHARARVQGRACKGARARAHVQGAHEPISRHAPGGGGR
jgi:hypothetical protein